MLQNRAIPAAPPCQTGVGVTGTGLSAAQPCDPLDAPRKCSWNRNYPALTAASLPALLLFLAIGYWLGGVMTSSQATSSVSAFLLVGFLFISGAGIPLWLLPETVQQVISWLPPALSVDPLFWAANSPFQRHDPWLTSGITIVLAALVMLAAIRTFRWEVRSR